ncbi:hypothetical protein A5740_14740 [Mycobacterium sp. GA-1841]|uniref:FUSC family protein n=1 Tax=Mycobacterium sp. GA-1841 TaxID=1834154 RepID=UPI00096D15A4|nr:FUSC family protein [Mycobacterium sp. GA-1841]OMC31613.1 hypothetical protein A5740_14740 [Mycobacterium sp. GA-1841]
MTGPENSPSGTRPISVAELLAKNGTIGAPPVGGRRRRRRGNSDAVTVAELTGEIPVITDDMELDDARDEPVPQPNPLVDTTVVEPIRDAPRDEPRPAAGRNGGPRPQSEPRTGRSKAFARPVEPEPVRTDAEDDYDAHLAARDADPEPVEFRPRPRRAPSKRPARDYEPSGTGAERMSPDPLYDFSDDDVSDGDVTDDAAPRDADVPAEPDVDAIDDVADIDGADATDDANYGDYDDYGDYGDYGDRSYSSLGPLFGGESEADGPDESAVDTEFDEHDEFSEDETPSSPLVRGLWIVGQCVIAVAFGAGLFVAFDQLWKWNTIVALVLGVLVILGLAGGVRVVRKTEDIGSTLTAVAVGALVTFGPLALLQAS